jgi:hypothetical protein
VRGGAFWRERRGMPTRRLETAIGAGAFAHAFAWARQRDALPREEPPGFDATRAADVHQR